MPAQLLTMTVQKGTAPISPRALTVEIFACNHSREDRSAGLIVFVENLKEVGEDLASSLPYLQRYRWHW